MSTNNVIQIKNYFKYNLWDLIISRENMLLAYKKVKSNKGVAGIDGMKVEEFVRYFNTNGKKLLDALKNQTYQPQPTVKHRFPKPNSEKFRVISVPTVIDRVIQQAISQIITPYIDKTFSPNSYAYRPSKSTHDALLKVKQLVDEGKHYVVKIDIKDFFDTVPQFKVIRRLNKLIKNFEICSFIQKSFVAGSFMDGRHIKTNVGIPQGSPLSPLLSNIYLDSLDKFLEDRDVSFVRFSDDCIILAKSISEALQIKRKVVSYIRYKLNLIINQEKTEIMHINKAKFLGYGFYLSKDGCRFRLHPETKMQLVQKIMDIFTITNGKDSLHLSLRIRSFMLGWLNYYKMADMRSHLIEIDKKIRELVRCRICKGWVESKILSRKLVDLGLKERFAKTFEQNAEKYNNFNKNIVLKYTLTNERLLWMGYDSFTEHYDFLRVL